MNSLRKEINDFLDNIDEFLNNNFIEQLDLDPQELEMTEIIGEKITNKIFDEIKSNI